MAQLTHDQLEALERAVTSRTRLAVFRRGTEYVVIPDRLGQVNGRDVMEAVHPSTGERMDFVLEEVDGFEVIG